MRKEEVSPSPVRILLIEDEAAVRRFLRASLDPAAFTLDEATDGTGGLQRAAQNRPDLVLLDLGLPDLDGVEVCRRLRAWSTVPIVVLSARDGEAAKVEALDAGADDYLTKPFGLGELHARIRVALRHARSGAAETSVVAFGDVRIDLAARRVERGGAEVHLTPNEHGLLVALARRAGGVVTHKTLLREVWGEAYVEESHYLRVYMGQLRHKLEVDPGQPRFLLNEPGAGYRLKVE